MRKTQPEIVKKLSIRVTKSEYDHVEDMATRNREPLAQTIRLIVDKFRLGKIGLDETQVLPFTDDVCDKSIECGFFEDQARHIEIQCKKQKTTRAKFIRSLIRRVPQSG